MKGLLRRLHRTSAAKMSPKSTSTSESPTSSGRSSLFRQSSTNFDNLVLKMFVPASRLKCETPVPSSRGRKRDRLRNYLSRRRNNKKKDDMSYLWPMDPTDKDDIRSSDDTEDGDDTYVVDYYSDSNSDEDSLCDDGYVLPPVTIPDMYRRQDRMGGITVAGDRVLFTYAGFKRRQMLMGKLQGIPEVTELVLPGRMQRESIFRGDEF